MIKTVKNNKTNRIIGISINGKRFSVNRDVCLALSLEEELLKRKVKEIKTEIKSIKTSLTEKQYVGNSELFKFSLKFDQDGLIDGAKSLVNFVNDHTQDERSQVIGLLESFIDAFNDAQRKRVQDLNGTLKDTYCKLDKVS